MLASAKINGELMAEISVTKKKKNEGTKKSKIAALKKELDERDKTIEEHISQIKYLQADFENYKKAFERERESIVRCANDDLILKLLDVFENLERALENGKSSKEKEPLLEGIEMTFRQMKAMLEKEGLKKIEAVGEKLDPFKHEALMQEEKRDMGEGTIIEELQRGYMLRDRVIRCSKVKVSRR